MKLIWRSRFDDALIAALFWVLKHRVTKIRWVQDLQDTHGKRRRVDGLFSPKTQKRWRIYLDHSFQRRSRKERLQLFIHELMHGIVSIGTSRKAAEVEHLIVNASEKYVYRRLSSGERRTLDWWLKHRTKKGSQPRK